MRKLRVFFLILIFAASGILLAAADFGESSANLGQITDEFDTLDNVSVRVLIERNATLNVMELNGTSGSVGFLTGWDQRVKITIDHDDIDAGLVDFPVLIYISDSSGINNEDITFVFDEVGANSLKIAITESDGTTECFVEVEKWDFGNEKARLWAKDPSIASGVDTDLYLYFDNDHADNGARVGPPNSVPAENVWDTNFDFVSHMRDDPDNRHIRDSTDNDKDGTKGGNNEPVLRVDGIISEDQDFDGDDDYIDIPNTIMPAASPFTLEFWFNCDGINSHTENWQMLLEMRGQFQTFIDFWEKDDGVHPGEIEFYIYDGVDEIRIYSAELNYATDYYIMATHDAANDMRLYINGVLVAGPVAQDDPNPTSGQNRIGKDQSPQTRGNFKGKIDETRTSSVARLGSWALATYETGRDDLIDYGSLVGAGGFASEGYFTTTDYLDYVNGSTLALMTQSRIFPNTFITVQFSNDNATWGDAEGIPGASHDLLGGLETIDLRPWNESISAYVMYNLSTSDVSITPFLNQSRLITTLGQVGAGAPGQNVSSKWVTYNLTSIDVLIGTHDSGDVNSTLDIDGDTFNCSEAAGAPGYRLSFNWTGVDDAAGCLWVVSNVFYDGNQAHDVHIELWNFTALGWVEIGTINDGVDFSWENVTVYGLRIPNDFVNTSGAVLGRFEHVAPGNINHDIHVEYLKLLAEIPAGPSPGAGTVVNIIESDFPWIAIAIILMCVAYLLFRPK